MRCAVRRTCERHGDMGNGAGPEVVGACLEGPDVVVVDRSEVLGVWRAISRGGAWGAAVRYVNKQRLVHCLAAGEICVQSTGHGLLGPQNPLLPLALAGHNAQRQIGGVELAAERVAIFSQNQFANVVDQVLLVNGDESRRRAGPLDPEFAGDHGRADGQQLFGGAVVELIGLPSIQQGPDQRRLSVGQQTLPSRRRGWTGARRGRWAQLSAW